MLKNLKALCEIFVYPLIGGIHAPINIVFFNEIKFIFFKL
jgi:hypothetical protein